MTDIYDQATEQEELHRNNAIQTVRNRAASAPKYSGRCLYCNTELLKLGRFCRGEDCGEQWEYEQKMLKASGQLR